MTQSNRSSVASERNINKSKNDDTDDDNRSNDEENITNDNSRSRGSSVRSRASSRALDAPDSNGHSNRNSSFTTRSSAGRNGNNKGSVNSKGDNTNKPKNNKEPSVQDRKPHHEHQQQAPRVRLPELDAGDFEQFGAQISRQERHRREAVCNQIVQNPQNPVIFVAKPVQHATFHASEDCVPLDHAKPSETSVDRLGVVHEHVYSKHVCADIGGHWHSDPLEKADGTDVCFVTHDDARCAAECNQDHCRRLENAYHDVLGPLAGTCVRKDVYGKARTLLKGRLPVEWPKHGDPNKPLNQAVLNYFGTEDHHARMSTPPMNANRPKIGDSVTAENKEKACAGRSSENLSAMRAGLHQAVVYTIAQALVNERPMHGPRGILVWHSTGSGKTATAAGVAEAFWHAKCPSNPNRMRRIIYLCTPDAIKSNPPEEFAKEARRFFKPDWKREYMEAKKSGKELCVVDEQAKRMAVKYSASMDYNPDGKRGSRMALVSFAELSNKLGLTKDIEKRDPEFCKDAVLIIDEVHNLFKPLAGQSKENALVRDWLVNKKFDADKGDMKVVIMTATPGDTIPQVEKLLQLVQDPSKPPITVPELNDVDGMTRFANSVRGLVSFLDLSKDLRKFPRISKDDNVMCEMSVDHAKEYAHTYRAFETAVANLNFEIMRLSKAMGSRAPPGLRPFMDAESFATKVVLSGNGEITDTEKVDDNSKSNDTKAVVSEGEWFNVDHKQLGVHVKKALDAYANVRKHSNWSGIKKGVQEALQEAQDPLQALSKYSRKTFEFIRVLKEHPRAKHYAYTEFKRTCDGANGWAPGAQFLGKSLELCLGYERMYIDHVIEIMQALRMKQDDSKKPKPRAAENAHNKKKAAVRGCLNGGGAKNAGSAEENETKRQKSKAIVDATEARAIVDRIMTARLGRDTRGKQFYVMLLSTAFTKSDGAQLSDAQKDLAAGNIKALYNSLPNVHGGIIHVLLASDKYNESIDLQGVQHLHMIEPFKSMAAEMQAIGRARRNCSHMQLGYNQDWHINLHRYISVLPRDSTLDTFLAHAKSGGGARKAENAGRAKAREHFRLVPRGRDTIDHVVTRGRRMAYHKLEIVYEIIKQRAVDCRLFSKFHGGINCNGDIAAVLRDAHQQEAEERRNRPRDEAVEAPRHEHPSLPSAPPLDSGAHRRGDLERHNSVSSLNGRSHPSNIRNDTRPVPQSRDPRLETMGSVSRQARIKALREALKGMLELHGRLDGAIRALQLARGRRGRAA